jgi:hypothetical protein
VRFLGRKVYVEIAILVSCVLGRCGSGIAARTVARWRSWWRTVFVASTLFVGLRARLVPPIDEGAVPGSLLARLARPSQEETLLVAAAMLAPMTTASVRDGARFVRVG